MLHRFARLLLTRTAIAPVLRTQARAACRSGEHRQAIVLSGVCALLVLTCTGRPIHMAAQVLGMLREPPSVLRVQTLASVPQTPGGCPRDASMTMSVRTPMNHRKPLQDRTRLPSGREPAADGLAAGAGPARTTGPVQGAGLRSAGGSGVVAGRAVGRHHAPMGAPDGVGVFGTCRNPGPDRRSPLSPSGREPAHGTAGQAGGMSGSCGAGPRRSRVDERPGDRRDRVHRCDAGRKVRGRGHGVAVMDDGSNGNARRPLGVAAFPEADVADADLGDFLQRRSRRRECIWRRGRMAASPCVRPAEGPRSMCAAR